MKRYFNKFLMIICMAMFMISLSACQQESDTKPTGKEPQSIGEVILSGANSEYYASEITEEYIRVVNDDYVCESKMTPEIYAKLEEVDFFAEDKDQQYAEILKDYPIDKLELRSDSQLSEEEMKNLIGKSGQELLDMGFENFGYNLNEENAVFFMDRNGYSYNVVVEESFEETDDFDAYEALGKSTIKEFAE